MQVENLKFLFAILFPSLLESHVSAQFRETRRNKEVLQRRELERQDSNQFFRELQPVKRITKPEDEQRYAIMLRDFGKDDNENKDRTYYEMTPNSEFNLEGTKTQPQKLADSNFGKGINQFLFQKENRRPLRAFRWKIIPRKANIRLGREHSEEDDDEGSHADLESEPDRDDDEGDLDLPQDSEAEEFATEQPQPEPITVKTPGSTWHPIKKFFRKKIPALCKLYMHHEKSVESVLMYFLNMGSRPIHTSVMDYCKKTVEAHDAEKANEVKKPKSSIGKLFGWLSKTLGGGKRSNTERVSEENHDRIENKEAAEMVMQPQVVNLIISADAALAVDTGPDENMDKHDRRHERSLSIQLPYDKADQFQLYKNEAGSDSRKEFHETREEEEFWKTVENFVNEKPEKNNYERKRSVTNSCNEKGCDPSKQLSLPDNDTPKDISDLNDLIAVLTDFEAPTMKRKRRTETGADIINTFNKVQSNDASLVGEGSLLEEGSEKHPIADLVAVEQDNRLDANHHHHPKYGHSWAAKFFREHKTYTIIVIVAIILLLLIILICLCRKRISKCCKRCRGECDDAIKYTASKRGKHRKKVQDSKAEKRSRKGKQRIKSAESGVDGESTDKEASDSDDIYYTINVTMTNADTQTPSDIVRLNEK